VKLRMAVKQGAEQMATGALDLGDQRHRLADRHQGLAAGVEEALGMTPVREAQARLRGEECHLVGVTLNLLLAADSAERKVIFADPAGGGSVEALLAALAPRLTVRRVMYPLPDETARGYVPAPALMRQRHADLWHALSADDRAKSLLVAGPTAAYLAPALGEEATTVVAVHDPGSARASGAWRSVLGPFPELDEIPEEAGSERERDRWVDRLRAATSQLELVRADVAGVTVEIARRVGLGPKAASKAAAVAASAARDEQGPRSRNEPPHWLDMALYSLSRAPEQDRPRKPRRR
jgi:hypothetical protein